MIPYGLQPARLLCSWDFAGKNAGWWPFPPLGDLPSPGIEPTSTSWAGRFSTVEPPGKPPYLSIHLSVDKLFNWPRGLCPSMAGTLRHTRAVFWACASLVTTSQETQLQGSELGSATLHGAIFTFNDTYLLKMGLMRFHCDLDSRSKYSVLEMLKAGRNCLLISQCGRGLCTDRPLSTPLSGVLTTQGPLWGRSTLREARALSLSRVHYGWGTLIQKQQKLFVETVNGHSWTVRGQSIMATANLFNYCKIMK